MDVRSEGQAAAAGVRGGALRRDLRRDRLHEQQPGEVAAVGAAAVGDLAECAERVGDRLTGGHVAAAIARVAASVGFHVVVCDDREEFASAERFPNAASLVLVHGLSGRWQGFLAIMPYLLLRHTV